MVNAVIVTYKPDFKQIIRTIESLESQINKIFVVDNTPHEEINTKFYKEYKNINPAKIEIISLKKNMGIALAQNIGIKAALDNRCNYILLSDQDTIYPNNYINKMIGLYKELENGNSICSISPAFYDCNKKIVNDFIIKRSLFIKRSKRKDNVVDAFEVIASGQIIKTEALLLIGLMDENLFIDWVDSEWCWRAKNKGFRIIGHYGITIKHTLGNITVNNRILRSSERYYYMTRNGIFLAINNKNISIACRFGIVVKVIEYIVAYTLLNKPRLVNFTTMLQGVYDGLKKNMGRRERRS